MNAHNKLNNLLKVEIGVAVEAEGTSEETPTFEVISGAVVTSGDAADMEEDSIVADLEEEEVATHPRLILASQITTIITVIMGNTDKGWDNGTESTRCSSNPTLAMGKVLTMEVNPAQTYGKLCTQTKYGRQ